MQLTDLQQKLILLAFDASAASGEADNAIKALFQAWRKEYPDGHDFVKALAGNGNGASPPTPRDGVDYGETELTFSKHKGKRLKEVDPGWLMMALDTTPPERINKYVREAIRRYLRDNQYRT